MNNQTNDIEKPFMEVVTNKIEKQDEKITGLEERVKNLPNYSDDINQIKREVGEIKSSVKNIHFPAQKIENLSTNLDTAVILLKQPAQQKVIHHHYMDKALWAVAILFNVVVALVVLLSNARNEISENRESDIKYRTLKLSYDKNLLQAVQKADSLYLTDPEQMRENVIQEEKRRKEQMELNQQAEDMEKEAKRLKEKANSK